MGPSDHLDLDVHANPRHTSGLAGDYRCVAPEPEIRGAQLSFDAITDTGFDTPLSQMTFVVVDLETTGGSAAADRITEIGAVKVRGGEIIGELATLVDPGRAIPPHVVALTGITEAMVYQAPRIDEVLPAFLEFAHGCVLVAHNAGFDMSFLRAAAAELGHPWSFRRVLCTVKLARRVLSREEAPTVKLAALARHFSITTTPNHRALDDARATVEVMHALFERVGNLGVHSYRDVLDFLPGLSTEQRAKRQLTDHLPNRPGVYLFRGPSREVLYVGTASDLRRRTRQYFTGSETRARMREMVTLSASIDHVECAHRLEAGVRELRMLAAHSPAYNRRSKTPHRGWWVCLTEEPFPRLKVSHTPTPVAVGPIRVRGDAASMADLIAEVTRLRSCSRHLSAVAAHSCAASADGRRPVGGCHAAAASPVDAGGYTPAVERAAALITGSDDSSLRRVLERLRTLASVEMFETAARLRDRLAATLAGLERCQRFTALCAISEMVAARPDGSGGWELAVIRHGRLASAGVAARGVAPMPVAQSLTLAAETVVPGLGPLRGAAAQEVGVIYSWLVTPGTRIVCSTEPFMLPIGSAARWGGWRETVASAHVRSRELAALAR